MEILKEKYNLDDLYLEENIALKRILKGVFCEDIDWIHLAEEKTGYNCISLMRDSKHPGKETHLDCWNVLPVVIYLNVEIMYQEITQNPT